MERKNAITYTHTDIKFKVVRRERESNQLIAVLNSALKFNIQLHYLKVDLYVCIP